ncbi:MAG: ligase-associated DNA damage response endonuclease PdeM [Polyangiaceae bacterium]|nr:ligase-associated DNA damage response endonuclease PdeM [Polyangiaceae bacterium]
MKRRAAGLTGRAAGSVPPGASIAVNVAGEALTLLAERAIFWAAREALLVADLHWGKTETFRAHGIALPDGTLGGDLGRLASALDRTAARRVIVLGDLVHHATGITPALIEQIAAFRRRRAVEFWLVRGNHDKHSIVFPEAWGVRIIEHELADGPFLLRHEPVPAAGRYVWAGHLHPQVRLVGRGDALTLPCFHLGRDVGVLPAFSEFTGGLLVRRRPGERTFALVEGRVIEVLRPIVDALTLAVSRS